MARKSNGNLRKAAGTKNDEFYTQLSDIENELKHYKGHFKGKVVFCNCDDPKESNFVKYFSLNFQHLGLKKLIATHYKDSTLSNDPPHALVFNGNVFTQQLLGDGDFRSEECLSLLAEADIVVTNPPFSLFREYIDQLVTHDKEFLAIGNMNAISYKEVFKLIQANKVWLGTTHPKKFKQPNGEIKTFGNIEWFTNLTHKKRNDKITLYKTYTSKDFPKYDNYNAIEVSKVSDIPVGFKGEMGVPITFLGKYNPNQFEIVDINPHFFTIVSQGLPKPSQLKLKGQKDPYARIIIKAK